MSLDSSLKAPTNSFLPLNVYIIIEHFIRFFYSLNYFLVLLFKCVTVTGLVHFVADCIEAIINEHDKANSLVVIAEMPCTSNGRDAKYAWL